MSNEHDKAHEASGDADDIDFFKVIAVGVVSLVIFAIATWWAATILRRETERVHGSERGEVATARPVEVGRGEIGIVDQVPFTADRRLENWRNEREQRLHGWEWVDRKKKVISIPIEKAMDQVAAGALPAGAPQ
jgi:hypothetical protein